MLKNKFFLCFIIILSIFVLLSGSVYATEEVNTDDKYGFVYTDQNGKVYELPAYPEELNEYNHYVVIKSSIWDYFYLILFNDTFEVINNTSNGFNVLADGKNFYELYWQCRFDIGTPDSWTLTGSSLGHGVGPFSKTNNPYYVVDSCACFSSYQNKLQDAIDDNESFFSNRQGVLVPIMEKAPLAKVMEEIMEILPVILIVIVALIAIRKAIAFLKKILNQS